jgi:hypothetical protein
MLGTLAELKAFVLAESLVPSSDFDANLTLIGDGVHKQFNSHCNRTLEAVAAAKKTFTANRSFLIADAYPLNTQPASVPTIELCSSMVGGVEQWVAQPDVLANINFDAGLVYLQSYLGDYQARIRMTYTGGYTITGAPPAGGVALPSDIKLAWLLQCQALWLVRDDLGTAVAGQKGGGALLGLSLPGYDLIPEVKTLLGEYRRMAISG